MRSKAEAVIIGGGVVGTAIAYRLAKKGMTETVVLERNFLSAGATGRCGGGMRQQWSTKTNVLLAKHSVAEFTNFKDVMGQNIQYRQGGYLLPAFNDEMLSELKTNVALQNSLGVNTRLVMPEEVKGISPILNTSDIIGASFGPTDGVANPFLTVKGYADRARDLGVEINIRTAVTGIEHDKNRVTMVRTDRGDIETGWVVNAAGAWAAQIGKMAGVDIPVELYRHQILVTEPVEIIHPCMVIDLLHNIYFSQAEEGSFIGGQTDKGESSSYNTRNNSRFVVEFARKITYWAPVLRGIKVVRQWAGLYAMTPDAQPILGSIPPFDNFVCAVGFSGHGFMLAPAAARLVTDYMLQGRSDLADISEMSIKRFEEGEITREKSVV
jgi:sarcosine oxidase subunit beta